MAKKYYAVKNGLTPGIFETWDQCKAQVDGFPGAVYKSFKTLEEAREYLGDIKSESEMDLSLIESEIDTVETIPSKESRTKKSPKEEDNRVLVSLEDQGVTLIPSLAEIKTSKDTHTISPSNWKVQDGQILATGVSTLSLTSIRREAKERVLKQMNEGSFRGSILLPYRDSADHLLGQWERGDTRITFAGGEAGTDRMFLMKGGAQVPSYERGSFMTVCCDQHCIWINCTEEEYENLRPGFAGSVVFRDFYGGKSYLFYGKIIHLPEPGRDPGHYVYVDGSGIGQVENGYGWGYVYQQGQDTGYGYGDGVSPEANHAAEQDACIHALTEAADHPEDLAIFFDNTNIAYGPVGWYKMSPQYYEQVAPLLLKHKRVTFMHVDGHAGVLGNEIADHLSNFEKREKIKGL